MVSLRNSGKLRQWLEPLALFVCCLVLFWAGNDSTSLWDRDEPRYAETARTMSATGDYIVPYFNGEFRFQKPVLTYWLIALSTALFGDSMFALRAPAGIAVAAGCLVLYRLGNQMFGRPAGLIAAIMTATAPTVLFLGKLCIPDGPQFFFATVCFYGLYQSWKISKISDAEENRPAYGSGQVWFWLALSGSILTKGPIVLGMLLATMVVLYLLCKAKLRDFELRWLPGTLLLLLTALPWFAVIQYTSGSGFFAESLGKQLGERTVVSFDGRWLPPGYYALTLVLGFLPWLAFSGLAVVRYRDQWRTPGPVAFLIAWIVGPMVLLELFRSKQLHYYAPAYPALALLAAGYLAAVLRGDIAWQTDWHSRVCFHSWRTLGVILAIAFVVIAAFGPGSSSVFALLASTLVAIGTFFSGDALRHQEIRRAFIIQSVLLASSWWIVGALLLPAMESERIVRLVAESMAEQNEKDGTPIVTRDLFEPSMIYYAGITVPNFHDDDTLIAVLRAADSDRLMPVTERELHRLEPALGPRLQIEKTWRGWVKMHRDVVHLVRIKPPADILAAQQEDWPMR